MKKIFFIVIVVALSQSTQAQPLFTYGKKSVTKTEFLKAFDKNPSPTGTNRKDALKEYLGLYINYKLKVQAAYDDKLNEQPSFINESSNFKKQLAENIINNEANIDKLIQEAFERSQKDIKVAQIFIELKAGVDVVNASKQIQKAYNALKQGKDFTEAVKEFSNDESTIETNGDLGYITSFTLPYEFENEIYALKQGEFSAPYKSSLGYHIFKNVEERKAIGKRKVAQILLAVPNDATDNMKQNLATLADSIYTLATTSGVSFETLVEQFSNDRATIGNQGIIPEVGIGQFDTDFEQQIFSLQQKGDISKPFLTKYGWHIVKLLNIMPISTDNTDPIVLNALKQQVERTGRLAIARKTLVNKWMSLCKFKEEPIDEKEFMSFTDSAATDGSLTGFQKIKPTTILFSFAKQKITADEWAKFVRAIKQSGNTMGKLHTMVLLKEYQKIRCNEYYQEHIEDFYPSVKEQSKEFDEANLLFGAMDKHVWSKANEDTVGLKKYYDSHKEKYQWQSGITAIVVTSTSKQTASALVDSFKIGINNWRTIVSNYGANVLVDSSRFENNQLPITQSVVNEIGFISDIEKNNNDDSYTFIYITAIHSTPETRSFEDARGLTINDYQQVLEQKWLDALKKKYPVKVNQGVWSTVK
ncbi:MAG: peptidylprolyl isomerase [Chitinophagaceae bacterium]|nr:peptidylprolyl isomerase [Chitinophagaceae bacterium]MCW5904136.1 peptidylprolyl isomerase [Chitinophagaceae bacterium]